MIFKSYTYPQWSKYSSKPELEILVDVEDEVILNHKSKYVETPTSLSAAEIFLKNYLNIISELESCEFCTEYSENKNIRVDRWYWQKRNNYFNYDWLSFHSRKYIKL